MYHVVYDPFLLFNDASISKMIYVVYDPLYCVVGPIVGHNYKHLLIASLGSAEYT